MVESVLDSDNLAYTNLCFNPSPITFIDKTFKADNSIFLAYTNVCSYSEWLLLKWSTIGTGFNGAETNP